MGNSSPDVVVFFDFENIVYSLRNRDGQNPNFELLMDKCQEFGRVVLARAYADWVRHSSLIAPLQSSGFDPIYVPTFVYADSNSDRKTRKNAVDINIAIDAVEILFTQPHIETYILLSGDKDFVPLAHKLRRYGKRVIFLGIKGTTSAHVRQAVDDLIFYHELTDEFSSEQKLPQDIYQELKKAIQSLASAGKATDLYSLEHTLSELLGSFDVRHYSDQEGRPFRRFRDLIMEAQRLGHVRLVTSGVVHEVRLVSAKVPQKKSESLPKPVFEPPPPRTELEAAFDLLVEAAVKAQAEEKSPRAANIKNVMRRLRKDFDEKALTNEKGEHFSNFTEFVRLAARRGYVDISGKGIYLEIVPSGKKPERIATAKDTAAEDAVAEDAVAEDAVAETAGEAIIENSADRQVVGEDAIAGQAIAEQSPAGETPLEELAESGEESRLPTVQGQPGAQQAPQQVPSAASADGNLVDAEGIQEEEVAQTSPPFEASEQQVPDQPEVETQLASIPEQAAPSPARYQAPTPPALPEKFPNRLEANGIPIAEVALPPGLEYRRRALVLDALRTCQYPAPAQQIAQHVKQVRDRRQFDLPDKRVYQLITLARDLGLIRAVDPDQPEQGSFYRFHDEPEQVRAFIETRA